jgi:hypothetical protein
MDQHNLPSKHENAPVRLSAKSHVSFLGYISAVLGIVAFVWAIVSSSALGWVVFGSFLLATAASFIWPSLREKLQMLRGRVEDYPVLHRRASSYSNDLASLRAKALELMRVNSAVSLENRGNWENLKKAVNEVAIEALRERSFFISKQSLDRNRLVLVLEKGEVALCKGDKLIVVQTEDFYEMGTFEIVEVRTKEYYAYGGKDVDGVWLSDVRKEGEKTVVPGKIAILVERSGEQ